MLTPSKEIPSKVNLRHLWDRLKQHYLTTFTLLFAVSLGLSLAVSACSSSNEPNSTVTRPVGNATSQVSKVIRIGYQKYGTLTILKARGSLEQRLKPEGVSVQWVQFPAGPQLLEALNAGSLDFGHTGEAPPIFAQAAGAPFVYVANEPPNPKGEAILVQKNSPITDVAGLKGKKVTLNKGSNSEQHPDRIKAVLAELQKVDDWAATQPTEVAKLLSPDLGIDVPTLEEVAKRRPYSVKPITDEVITYQQKLADTFFELKLLPKQLRVSEVAQASK